MFFGREAMGEQLDGQEKQIGAKHKDAKFLGATRGPTDNGLQAVEVGVGSFVRPAG